MTKEKNKIRVEWIGIGSHPCSGHTAGYWILFSPQEPSYGSAESWWVKSSSSLGRLGFGRNDSNLLKLTISSLFASIVHLEGWGVFSFVLAKEVHYVSKKSEDLNTTF